jgi:hypothetical protein
VERRLVDVEKIVGYLDKTIYGLVDFHLKFDEWKKISEKFTKMRMSEKFVEQEKKPSVDQEDVRKTNQPWWKRTKKGSSQMVIEIE